MRFHVRRMHVDDLDRVYAIEMAAHRAPWSHGILKDCLLVGYDCRVLEIVQGHSKEIIGYIISRYYDNICHVLNLCVALAQQNKGYGRALLQQVIDSLVDSETKHILLEVRPSNAPALHLYQIMGFEQIEIKREYYRDQHGIEDAIVLQKSWL